MEEKFNNRSASRSGTLAASRAFTLIELLVVIAVVAMLGALLLPAQAGAKADTMRAQCQSNMRRLGTGYRLFEQDHNEMFPVAGLQGSNWQLAWDTYIHRYIGGTAPDSWLTVGRLPIEVSPKIEYCPTDAPGLNPKIYWMGNPPIYGLRSYAPVSCGTDYGFHVQVDAQGGTYPLPSIQLGIGIYWGYNTSSSPDWEAKSYRTSVVKDPAGTILLVEEPDSDQPAGNVWPCVCLAPTCSGNWSWSSLYQLDPTHPAATTASLVNEGWHTYQLHGGRFNYLFHDNHVEALKIEQTLGTGTTNAPKGMWTVAAGD
jgi:prepilin-type N-terminal cleavage/methylation domain-containing protein/prepilin-type processing-associated H-X9-DG protein